MESVKSVMLSPRSMTVSWCAASIVVGGRRESKTVGENSSIKSEIGDEIIEIFERESVAESFGEVVYNFGKGASSAKRKSGSY